MAAAAASLGCGWLLMQCRQPEYEAQASLAVRTAASRVQFARPASSPQPPDVAAVTTVAEELGSRATVAAAVARLGARAVQLQTPPWRRPQWLRRWWTPPPTARAARQRLRIAVAGQSRVLALSFTAPDPELAAAFLRALLAAYLARAAERGRAQEVARAGFVSAQAQSARTRLQAAEDSLQQTAVRQGLGDPAAALAAASARWQQLSAAATSAQLSQLEQADALAQGAPAASPSPAGEIGGVPTSLLVERATQAAKIESLAAQYRPKAAPLLQARRQLAALDASLAALRARDQQARQRALAAVRKQAVDLRQALAQQRRSQTHLQAALAAFDLQQNQVSALRQVYAALLVQLQQALAGAGGEDAPIRVTDPALVPAQRLSPRWAPTLASALVLGCLLGLASAWLLDRTDDALRWPEAEELGVPLAAVLPRLEQEKAFARAIDRCAAALLLAQADSGARVVQVTSAGAGAGKSVVATQLAYRLAEVSPAVLLLDANFARPASTLPGAGLAELLGGDAEVEQVLRRYSLAAGASPSFIAAGSTTTASPCWLASGAAADLLTAARARFDWVVIDGAAVEDGPEAGLWASLADCNLVAAAYARTSRRQLRHALDNLEHADGGGLAVVVNRVPTGAAPAQLELWRPQAAAAAVEASSLRQRA